MRLMPSAPRINRPAYCVAFARPKKRTHKIPFIVAEIGRAICAKESR